MTSITIDLTTPRTRPIDEAEACKNMTRVLDGFDNRIKQSEEILDRAIRQNTELEAMNANFKRNILPLSSAVCSGSICVIVTTTIAAPVVLTLGAAAGTVLLTYKCVTKYFTRK